MPLSVIGLKLQDLDKRNVFCMLLSQIVGCNEGKRNNILGRKPE